MPEIEGFKHPVRTINNDILGHLTLEDNKIRPLPGGTGRRPAGVDPRLSYLQSSVGLTGPAPEEVCFYEHIATVRHKDHRGPKHDQFFVAFRQTMDALMLEQQDARLYPEHVIKSDVKKTELRTHIYMVTRLPRQVPVLRSHEDWLAHIADPVIFDTLAYFLLKNNIISEEMYGSLK